MSETKPPDDIIDIEPQVIDENKADPGPLSRANLTRIAAVGIGALVLGLIGGSWAYRDWLSNYFPSDQIIGLSARVDALETANKETYKRADAIVALTEELKAKLGAAQSAADKSAKDAAASADIAQSQQSSLARMQQTLDEASSGLAALKSQLASSQGAATSATIDPALASRVAQLEQDVASLKQNLPAATSQAALDQAFAALKAKIDTGQGFADELATLARMDPLLPGLAALGLDKAGLPNAIQLSQQLQGLLVQIPKIEIPSSNAQGGSWLDDLGQLFSGIVTIKPIGNTDLPTLVAQAVAFASSGDLQQAIDTLKNVELPADLKAWLDAAQRRLRLEQALATVSNSLAGSVAGKG